MAHAVGPSWVRKLRTQHTGGIEGGIQGEKRGGRESSGRFLCVGAYVENVNNLSKGEGQEIEKNDDPNQFGGLWKNTSRKKLASCCFQKKGTESKRRVEKLRGGQCYLMQNIRKAFCKKEPKQIYGMIRVENQDGSSSTNLEK